MSKYRVQPASDKHRELWDDFVEAGNGGTIFHRLDFLGYHGKKFRENEHHLTILKGDSLFGVLPAAVFYDQDGVKLRSPYGASYGGPVFRKPLSYSESCFVIQEMLHYMNENGIDRTVLTMPLRTCYREYSETFRFALLENGFRSGNRDISSVVELDETIFLTATSRRKCRKALKAGVSVMLNAPLEDFWPLVEETHQRHETNPTHTKTEYALLQKRFPRRIFANVAYLSDQPVAAIGVFATNDRQASSFYICGNDKARECEAQSLVMVKTLQQACEQGFLAFDFGTSSVNMVGRAGVFRFKETFGSTGHFRERFKKGYLTR